MKAFSQAICICESWTSAIRAMKATRVIERLFNFTEKTMVKSWTIVYTHSLDNIVKRTRIIEGK